jgi:hypothetical protein
MKFFCSFSRKKGKTNIMPKTTDDADETKANLCMKCERANFSYVRVFDFTKLPREYFHQPSDTVTALLSSRNINRTDMYPDYWIHLPINLLKTRYPYKVCESCYKQEATEYLHPWNKWNEI